MNTSCPISVPPGQYCMLCNNVHEPLIVTVPRDWTKRDILIPVIIACILLIIVVVYLVHRWNTAYVRVKPVKPVPSHFPEGWWNDDSVYRFEDY